MGSHHEPRDYGVQLSFPQRIPHGYAGGSEFDSVRGSGVFVVADVTPNDEDDDEMWVWDVLKRGR